MNTHTDNEKSAGGGPPIQKMDTNRIVVNRTCRARPTHYDTPNIYNCQTITLEDALDLDMWDTEAWITNQVQGGYMTPKTAREFYGWCPDWLRDFAVERYSMAEAHP